MAIPACLSIVLHSAEDLRRLVILEELAPHGALARLD